MAKKAYVGAPTVEYIESTGTQYIDTGVTPNENFGFELDFMPLEATASSSAPNYINAGGAGGTGAVVNQRVAINVFVQSGTTGNGELQFGEYKTDNKLTRNVRQTISVINGVATLPDGTTQTITTSSFTSPNTLIIFGAHMTYGASVQRFSKMRLYSLKLYNGNTLIRDFAPAYNNSQYCLYDKVTDAYFYSSGSGSLSGGVGPKARSITKMYVGVSGTARKIVKGYVGDSTGVARQFFG